MAICSKHRCTRKVVARHLCFKHYRQLIRQENPLKYAYQTLKDNAKRRGKEFSLTLEQFEKFAVKTAYMHRKGRGRFSYTIDRIDPDKGYTPDNIQVLTNSDNVRKMHIDRMEVDSNNAVFLSRFSGADPPAEEKTSVPF
jgi:hypothetical protein